MNGLVLLVTYKAKNGMGEKFIEEVRSAGIMEKIQAEDGFVKYDYYLSAADTNEILLVEEWSSEEQQQAHLLTAHMGELKSIKEKYVTDTAVRKIML